MRRWVVDTSPLIFLAKLDHLDLLRNDLDARRMAQRLGIAPVGTLGLLLAARLRGEIQSLRAEIDRLRQAGFRVSPGLSQAVLREAGE